MSVFDKVWGLLKNDPELDAEHPIEVTVYPPYGDEPYQDQFTMNDLADFYFRRRHSNFPSFISISNLSGEGQAGGRMVADVVREVEAEIIGAIGVQSYQQQMDGLMSQRQYQKDGV